jgi:hypothetical protein
LILVVFGDKVSLLALGWPGTMIPPISASQVARITGTSHQSSTAILSLRVKSKNYGVALCCTPTMMITNLVGHPFTLGFDYLVSWISLINEQDGKGATRRVSRHEATSMHGEFEDCDLNTCQWY